MSRGWFRHSREHRLARYGKRTKRKSRPTMKAMPSRKPREPIVKLIVPVKMTDVKGPNIIEKRGRVGEPGGIIIRESKQPFGGNMNWREIPDFAEGWRSDSEGNIMIKSVKGEGGNYDIFTEEKDYHGQNKETFQNWRKARGDYTKITQISKNGKLLPLGSPEYKW